MADYRIVLQEIEPRLLDVGVSLFGYYEQKKAENNLSVHDHGACYEICYLDKGVQPYYIHKGDGQPQKYSLHGGEVFITRPFERHSTGEFNQQRGRLYWIQLDADSNALLGQTLENAAILRRALSSICTPIFWVPPSVSKHLTESFSLLCNPNDERFFRACQHLSLFVTELAVHHQKLTSSGVPDKRLSQKTLKALSFIEENLLNPALNIEAVAEHLHYSKAYMMTLFHREVGITMHEYLLQKKIEYACELLLHHSIIEVSLLLNFSSSQHFSKVFKERMRMTPHEYVKSRSVG